MKHLLISLVLIVMAVMDVGSQNNSKTYSLECRDEMGPVSIPIYVYMSLDTENKMIRLRWLSPVQLEMAPDQVALRKEKQTLVAELRWVYQKDSVVFYPPPPLIQLLPDANANSSTHTILYPDGTQTVASNNGTTSTIINPDGTHSVAFNHGNTSTVVNPDGTHSVIFNNGNTSTVINPDGTHSVVLNNGSTSTIVHPDGTHSVVFHNGNTSSVTGPTGFAAASVSATVNAPVNAPDTAVAAASPPPVCMFQTDFELVLDDEVLRSIRKAHQLEFEIQAGPTRLRAPLLGRQFKSLKRRLF